mmetsp:Transcript_32734/g.93075  ORF Transcript_32734/g.93075 Transcript_32734/m.93075 type:complete len:247 (-) Transcript_32734:720-1460(-)
MVLARRPRGGVVPEQVVEVQVVDDAREAHRILAPCLGEPIRGRGVGRVHEAEQHHVLLRGELLPHPWHHLLVERPDAHRRIPEVVQRLVQQLDAHHHARRGGLRLVVEDEVGERLRGPLPPLEVRALQEECGLVVSPPREAVDRLPAGQRVEVEDRLHPTLLQPPHEPPQVHLATVYEAIRDVVHGAHEPIPHGHTHMCDAEARELVQVLLPEEVLPMPVHDLLSPGILGPAVLRDQGPLVVDPLV